MFQEQPITIEFIEGMNAPSNRFLCPLEANDNGIEFTYYKLRDCEED